MFPLSQAAPKSFDSKGLNWNKTTSLNMRISKAAATSYPGYNAGAAETYFGPAKGRIYQKLFDTQK